jgi:putative pyruvate formate lyase activating enzyme
MGSAKSRLIQERKDSLYRRLERCNLCPRNCEVNRLKEEKGYCGIGKNLVVYTAFLHSGEEPPISGERGSGTIFFSGCNLKCVYCQNYKFSSLGEGRVISEERLGEIIIDMQNKGAHNINLVTPTHLLPQIIQALAFAFREGFTLPIVYNTSGYEKEDIIDLIEEIVDIYLVDMKYITPSLAIKYSHALDYPIINKKVVQKMYLQKKESVWVNNMLKEGIIIRHLALPGYVGETLKVLSWIKENTPQALVSLMCQYRPFFIANFYPPINRPLSISEYRQIKDFIERLNLEGWVQEFDPPQHLAGVNFSSKLHF